MFDNIRPTSRPYYQTSSVPTLGEINKHRFLLLQKSSNNSISQQKIDELSDMLHSSDCNALIIASQIKIDKALSAEENFFNSFLCCTALLSNLGLEMMYNGNFPAHIILNSKNRQNLLGHQDSYASSGGTLRLMPYLVLLNANSDSHDRTWVKESSKVISELEKQPDSQFLFILQKVRFDAFLNGKKIFDRHILLKNDEDNCLYFDQFSSRVQYIPDPQSLEDFKISQQDADSAISRLKYLVNKEDDKFYFCLNNNQTQIAVINNKISFHGRESEDCVAAVPSIRNIAVLVGTNLTSPIKPLSKL